MNHSSIGQSDEVTLAVRMPGILLYLTTNRMLLGKGVNRSMILFKVFVFPKNNCATAQCVNPGQGCHQAFKNTNTPKFTSTTELLSKYLKSTNI